MYSTWEQGLDLMLYTVVKHEAKFPRETSGCYCCHIQTAYAAITDAAAAAVGPHQDDHHGSLTYTLHSTEQIPFYDGGIPSNHP